MKKLGVLWLLLSLLVACQKVTHTPKPKNLIPEDTMVDLLVDLGKINALISINTKEFEKRQVDARRLVFEKYQIDSAQLAESAQFYAEDFKVNQSIYNRVNEILLRESDSLYEIDQKNAAEEKEKNTKNPIKPQINRERLKEMILEK